LAQRPAGPLTRILIGDAQPTGGPLSCSAIYIEEVGTTTQVTRFVAATILIVLTLGRSEREALKRQEAATSPGNSTMTPSPLYCNVAASAPCRHASATSSSTTSSAKPLPPLHHYSNGLRRLQRRHGRWQLRVAARFFSTVKVSTL